jgi:hypothetical protein
MSKRRLTWEQNIRLIAKRLRNPRITFTQEDRNLLANLVERLQRKYENAITDNSTIVFAERTSTKENR